MDWSRGPIQSLLNPNPSTGSGNARGGFFNSLPGGRNGLMGMLGSWVGDRFGSNDPIEGQGTVDQMTGNDINRTQGQIWNEGLPVNLSGDQTGAGPPAETMDPNAADMGPPMSHEEMQDARDDATGDGGSGTLAQLQGGWNQFSPGMTLYRSGAVSPGQDPNGKYVYRNDDQ
jgi:hypothetical protein